MLRWCRIKVLYFLVLVVGLSMACRRRANHDQPQEGAAPVGSETAHAAVSAASAVDASVVSADDASAPPAGSLGEPHLFLAATAKQPIALSRLGPQVLVRGKGGPYSLGVDGALVASPMQRGLDNEDLIDIVGTNPDDAWALSFSVSSGGDRNGTTYYVERWQSGQWKNIPFDVELTDTPGTWFEGIAAMGPGKAVALSHRAEEKALIDVLSTVDPKGGSSRDVGSSVGQAAQDMHMVGLANGDVYISSSWAGLVYVPVKGKEQTIALPQLPGDSESPEIRALAGIANASVVAAFRGKKTVAVGTLHDTKWNVVKCPFADDISNVAPTADGAIWVTTQTALWRYLQRWEAVPLPRDILRKAGVTSKRVHGLAATSADDAWLAVGDGVDGGQSGLLHTKPAAAVQHLPLPVPAGTRP